MTHNRDHIVISGIISSGVIEPKDQAKLNSIAESSPESGLGFVQSCRVLIILWKYLRPV